MYPLLLAWIAAVFLFSVFLLIGKLVLNRELAVQERILGIQGEKNEKRPPRRLRKRKKTGKSAAARTRKELERLENELYDVGVRMPALQLLTVWVAAAVALPTLLSLLGCSGVLCALSVLICAAGPLFYVKLRKRQRREQLDSQLTEAISTLCSALRAGHSFQQAMNSITEEMEGPIAEEFGRVFRETRHGMTLQDSMSRMVERTGSEDLEMMCTAILIQREIGGNLAEVLENVSATIRSRLTLRSEIRTRTASGRLSGYLVGSLPVVLLLCFSMFNPAYMAPLFSTATGRIMLLTGAVLELVGFAVIRRVVNVKY